MGKFPHIVIPWDKEIENLFHQLAKDRVAYTKNTHVASDLGRRYPELIDDGFLDIVTTNYRKKSPETIIIMRPNVVSIQKIKKFSFHKIF